MASLDYQALYRLQDRVLDNLTNLGANKICAVLGRDDPKDIFDLYTIYRLPAIDWPSIRTAAGEKCNIDKEELRLRLESFPLSMLDILPVTDKQFVAELHRDYPALITCLLS